MATNRKILFIILGLFALCAIMAVIDISIKSINQKAAQNESEESSHISIPSLIKSRKFGNGVGIVRVEGTIEFATSKQFGIKTGAEAVINRINSLSANKDIKAIVLRINSPGGTVAATQEIYQRLMQVRNDIPVIASIGDMGASGGYYIASACHYIYANPGSMTGSIGVIAYSPNLKGLLEKIGVDMNVIKSGRYKDIMSSHRNMSDDERRLMQSMIDSSYRRFLSDVSAGRDVPQSQILPYADGRIMDGLAAAEAGLIDGVGSLSDAIAKAKEAADLPEDAPVYDDAANSFQDLLLQLEGMLGGGNILEKVSDKDSFYRLEYRYMP